MGGGAHGGVGSGCGREEAWFSERRLLLTGFVLNSPGSLVHRCHAFFGGCSFVRPVDVDSVAGQSTRIDAHARAHQQYGAPRVQMQR